MGDNYMDGLNKDIEMGIKFLRGVNLHNSLFYDDVFLHTNELISDYYNKFPIKNGNVLTIASGGDHILQAVYEKASSIDAFDINRFALYMSKLKIAALKALDYDEFNKYFTYHHISDFKMFNRISYLKMRDWLNDNDREFWDNMYSKGDFEYDYVNLILSITPSDDGRKSYVKEDNFYITKENLNDVSINFYHSGFFDVFDKLPKDKKYDAIFLSNIYDWFYPNNIEEFPDIVDNVINCRLTDRGMAALYAPICENKGMELYDGYIERMGNRLVVTKKRLKK